MSALLACLLAGCASVPPKQLPVDTAASDAAQGAVQSGKPRQNDPENTASNKAELYPGTAVFVKAPRETSTEAATSRGVMLNFDNADVREVVSAIIGDLLKSSYIVDAKVQGTISLQTSGPIPNDALLPTLETLLRMNGAVILKEDGVYKVVPAATVRGSVTPQVAGANPPAPTSGYTVRIVPLKFIAAKEMVKILEPFALETSAVRIDELRNLMILAGTVRELRHLQETIDIFDVDWLSGMSVGLFALQNVDPKTAIAELEKVLGGATQNSAIELVKLVPMERLNSVLVVTPQPKYLDLAKIWIDRLDRSGTGSGGTRLFVYPLQNGRAETIAGLLNDIFGKSQGGGARAAPALAPGSVPATIASSSAQRTSSAPSGAGDNIGVGDIRVIADKDNNALLILTSPSDYEKIESAIRKLDIVARQVLIDVTIAEVTLVDEFRYGLEWFITKGPRRTGKLDTGASGITALAPGFSYVWSNPSVPGNVDAVLNIIATDERIKVISSPHVMVTDNQTAKIQVGDRVPTTSQTQTIPTGGAPSVVSSVQYLDTGTLLSITPRINTGGLVTMDINQEVSTASQTTTSGIDSPTISKRSVQSTVVVRTGETMVLGGLITETNTNSSSGIPFLSKIPVLGALFGNQGYKNNRTELVVLITPRVVANSQQARDVTDEFRKKARGLAKLLEKTGKFDEVDAKTKQSASPVSNVSPATTTDTAPVRDNAASSTTNKPAAATDNAASAPSNDVKAPIKDLPPAETAVAPDSGAKTAPINNDTPTASGNNASVPTNNGNVPTQDTLPAAAAPNSGASSPADNTASPSTPGALAAPGADNASVPTNNGNVPTQDTSPAADVTAPSPSSEAAPVSNSPLVPRNDAPAR